MKTHGENDAPDIEDAIARMSRMMRRLQGGGQHHFPGGHRLLEILIEEDGIRASTLAHRLDIRPSSLTDALNRMEQHGLIERRRDEDDSRVTRVHITETGYLKFQERKKGHVEWSKTLNACISREEAEQFCAVAAKIIAFLEAQPAARGSHGGRCEKGRGHE